jgi:glycosyltransferase involved in cell wall biosynthesis
VQAIASRQARDGHQATILATRAAELSALWSRRAKVVSETAPTLLDGVEIVRLPVRHLPAGSVLFPGLRWLEWASGFSFPTLATRLSRLAPWVPGLSGTLEGMSPDLLFAWNITLEGLTAVTALVAERKGVSWIAVPLLHLARPRFYTMPHQLALLEQADAVIALTEHERQFLVASGLDVDAVHVVSPGVDLEEAQQGDSVRFRKRLGIEGQLVLMLAPLCYDKGTEHLLVAMRQLWEQGSRATLCMVGPLQDSRTRRTLERTQRAHGDSIRYLGVVPEQQKWDAIAAADLIVLPSRTESFGMVFLEAWARSKAVIGARAGAVPDVVADGEDGRLVPFGDVQALASAMSELLADPELRCEMGRRGRRKVERYHTWDVQYAKMRNVWEAIAGA